MPEVIEMADSPDKPTDDTLENQMPGDERAHDMGLAHVKTKCLSISDPPERRDHHRSKTPKRVGRAAESH